MSNIVLFINKSHHQDKSNPIIVGERCRIQPLIPVYELRHRKTVSLIVLHQVKPSPIHSPIGPGPRPIIRVLAVVQRAQNLVVVSRPFRPPRRVDNVVNERLDVHCRGKVPPWPAQIGPGPPIAGREVVRGHDGAVLDRNSRDLVRVVAALGCDCVGLARRWQLRVDVAVLEDDCCIAEDEVDGARDVAVAVELAERVGVEGVLVAVDYATVDCREVRVDAQGHGLALGRAGRVLDCEVTG